MRVDYSDEITEEQVRKLDDLVRQEFERGDWVIVEQEILAAALMETQGDQ